MFVLKIYPMGIHAGDSIIAPIQTLSDKEYQEVRDEALDCLAEIGIATGVMFNCIIKEW